MDKKVISSQIENVILDQLKGNRKITFLAGAGLSAASGIPTFRGKDGYWVSGSKNYTPQEMGTKKMFNVNFNEVWCWFLYRISTCNSANPNIGHKELATIEQLIPERFSLISQNVDGLHFREGSEINNLYLIHGDLRFMRCADECTRQLFEIPEPLLQKKWDRDTPITTRDTELLKCPVCEGDSRPHVLWFDEFYNDYHFYLSSVLKIAKETGLLFIVGTSGATNLPQQIVETTIQRQGVVIDINPNENRFTASLERLKNGYRIEANSSEALVAIRKLISKHQ